MSIVGHRQCAIWKIGLIVNRQQPIRPDFEFATRHATQRDGSPGIRAVDHGAIKPRGDCVDLLSWVGQASACARDKDRTTRRNRFDSGRIGVEVRIPLRHCDTHFFRTAGWS